MNRLGMALAFIMVACMTMQAQAQTETDVDNAINQAQTYNLEGSKCYYAQKYDEALALFDKALSVYRKLGMYDGECNVCCKMAEIKQELCEYDESKRLFSMALALAVKGGDASKQLEILNEMWSLGTVTEDIELAHAASLAIDSLIDVSADDEMRLAYYVQKGKRAKQEQQYKLAEKWLMKCIEMVEAEQSPLVAYKYHVYSTLCDMYRDAGQYDDAIIYGQKAKTEYHAKYPPDDEGYYFQYSSLAEAYRRKGDRDSCMLYVDSVFFAEGRVDEPAMLCHIYLLRARCHSAFKEYEDALADYKKADEILAASYPQSNSTRVSILALLGGMEYRLGHYMASEQYYRQYALYTKQQYGERSLRYLNALIIQANAEGYAGHLDEGCGHYIAATNMLKTMMKESIPYMSAEERESYWDEVSTLFTSMTPYALKAERTNTAFITSCYDALVMSKSFLLETEKTLFGVVKKEGTAEDMRNYMKLSLLKNQIQKLEKDYANNADSIMALSQQADRLSLLLAERCRGYADVVDFMNIDYETVRHSLKKGEVLVDFTDFVSVSEGRKYVAYVISKDGKYPVVKHLFAESQMDSLALARLDMYYDQDYAPEVLKLLWEPLKDCIPDGATVYYVPSQMLFQVSLESLPMSDGTLLGDRYNFVRLSSARELVKKHDNVLSAKPKTAVLYGGLQYDMDASAMSEQAKRYDVPEMLVMRGDMVRGDSTFCYLPGTLREVEEIHKTLTANKWHTTERICNEGTEESFLCLHGNAPQVLHIATHGFYYTPVGAENVDYLKGYSDAMSLSGIVLSGGNAAWRGKTLPDNVMDGILTAADIARLDLEGTELVVLSACQTGQGRATSEGLYGLQRAFKKAGVETMLITLWNVSDKVATEFMTTFYNQLSSKQCRWDKRKAYHRTMAIIRERYPDPFDWAAFMMLD